MPTSLDVFASQVAQGQPIPFIATLALAGRGLRTASGLQRAFVDTAEMDVHTNDPEVSDAELERYALRTFARYPRTPELSGAYVLQVRRTRTTRDVFYVPAPTELSAP